MASTYGAIFGRSSDDRGVDVADFQPLCTHDGDGSSEQIDARRALPLRIGVGKMPADVARSRGAEDRIGHRVADRVGV